MYWGAGRECWYSGSRRGVGHQGHWGLLGGVGDQWGHQGCRGVLGVAGSICTQGLEGYRWHKGELGLLGV